MNITLVYSNLLVSVEAVHINKNNNKLTDSLAIVKI